MYDDGIINEEEFLFMWSQLSRRSPQLTPDGPRLNFDALTERSNVFRCSGTISKNRKAG